MDEETTDEGELDTPVPAEETAPSLKVQLARARRRCTPTERKWISALHKYGYSYYRAAEGLGMSKATAWRCLRRERVQRVLSLMEQIDVAEDAADRMLVKERYRGLIDSNLQDFFTDEGQLKAPHQWTPEQAACVKKYGYDRYGPYIELYDAKGATDSYARVLRMMSDRVELSGPNGGPMQTRNVTLESQITPEQADRDYLEIIKRTKTG